MGPTRDDFEIFKGVKSIAPKLSQVHNRKIYSFILTLIPAAAPDTSWGRPLTFFSNIRGSALPNVSMSMTENYRVERFEFSLFLSRCEQ